MLTLLLTLLLALPGTSTAAKSSPDVDPAWSADGNYVAFSRLQSEGPVDTSGSIWIVGRDGRGAHKISPDGDPSLFNHPAWSPDGAWLSFPVAARYSAPSVAVVRSDGSGYTVVMTASGSSAEALQAAWSPDGRRLALAGNAGLFLAGRDVWQAQPLTSGRGYPSWSPDGTRIVFAPDQGLGIVAVDSGAVTPLPAPAALAAWSPDGTRIAYATGCQVGVVSATATGKPHGRACGENETASVPSWSPDGRRFVYSQCASNGACGVYVVQASRPSHATKIARGDNPAWSPDGHRIAYARLVANRFRGIWLIYPNAAGARPLLH
jgi:Tol biopolymer transport system component